MKVEVAVLGSPSRTVLMVSVDVKQHWTELHFYTQAVSLWSTHYTVNSIMTYDTSLVSSEVKMSVTEL